MAKNDEVIKQLMAKIVSQKENLGVKPKVAWKTNAVFTYSDKAYFNLNTVSRPYVLVEALACLLDKHSNHEKAAKMLGVDAPDFMWAGYSVKDYVDDFKARIAVLAWEEKKNMLDATQAKLTSMFSEEATTEIELDNIAKLLG
jgi:hypothetical protein